MRTMWINSGDVSGVAETQRILERRTSRPWTERPIAWKLWKSACSIYCHQGFGGAAAIDRWRLESKYACSSAAFSLLWTSLLRLEIGVWRSTRAGLSLCQPRGGVLRDLIGNRSAMRASIGCIALGIDSSTLTHCTCETHAVGPRDWGALCMAAARLHNILIHHKVCRFKKSIHLTTEHETQLCSSPGTCIAPGDSVEN